MHDLCASFSDLVLVALTWTVLHVGVQRKKLSGALRSILVEVYPPMEEV